MGNLPSDFLKKANPSTVVAMAERPENCFFGDYPTLSEVSSVYGKQTAIQWLSVQLTAASEFCGARNMTVGQITTLATMIHSEYYWLKITEIMLFIYKWMKGTYGEQYGSVDPQSIMRSLATFVNTNRAIAYDEREKSIRRAEQDKAAENAVPMPDYVKENLAKIKWHTTGNGSQNTTSATGRESSPQGERNETK